VPVGSLPHLAVSLKMATANAKAADILAVTGLYGLSIIENIRIYSPHGKY